MAPMSVLMRDEAQTRAQLIDVHRYTVALDLTTGDETFESRAAIHFTARAAGDTFIELKPALLRSVTLDGQPLDPAGLNENRLALPGLTAGEHELLVDATMRYSRTGEGMHRFTDPTDGETYLYTQLFLQDAQRVFAVFDQPDLKAVFELNLTAPEGWTVLGNSVATDHGGGHWSLAPTPPISTYLVAVAAGPWHSVRTEHAGLPFGIHCRRSLAPHLDIDADEIFAITRACYDRYHEKFEEPYPFDSYDQAFVPEFNAGAMENPGLVTFRDEFVYRSAVTDTERQTRAMVIAHEMAHMWFGDLVTLTWWDDIWLNESFAEYMGYQTLTEATRYTDTWVAFGIDRKSWGYDADQRPSTHPVAPDPASVPDTAAAMLNFDGISYAKGASALRQLVAWLGEKDFLAGINTHFARHKFGNATLADFIDSLAASTDRDVHRWAEQWLRTSGVDTLTPTIGNANEGGTGTGGNGTDTGWTLHVTRRGDRPHRIAVGAYDRDLVDPGRLAPATASRSTSRDRTAPPSAPAAAPTSSSSTTATSVTPRSASTTAPGPPHSTASPASPTRSPAPSSGTRPATWSATANWPPPPTWKPPAPTSRTNPTSPSYKAYSASPPPRSPTATSPPTTAPPPSPPSPPSAAPSSAAPRTATRPACASPPYATSSPPPPNPTASRTGSARTASPAAPNSTPNCAGASSTASPSSAPWTTPPSPTNSPATPAPPARKAPPAAAPPSPTATPKPPPGNACSSPTTCPTTSSPPPPRASGSPNRPTS